MHRLKRSVSDVRVVNRLGIPVLVAMALAACGEGEELLEGERLDIASAPKHVIENRAAPLNLPPARANAGWTHVNGNVRHHLAHLALSRELSLAWSVSIGQGNDRRHRITADPVVADGRVFTLDSRARVSAHTTAGESLWAQDLTPASENADEGSGGGLAVARDAVFASSGFGTLTALEAATGDVRWVQNLESAVSGAPTVYEGIVYLVTRNSVGWAIDAKNGRVLWQAIGATSESGISGGSAPVVAGSQVVFPLPSGPAGCSNHRVRHADMGGKRYKRDSQARVQPIFRIDGSTGGVQWRRLCRQSFWSCLGIRCKYRCVCLGR